MRRVSQDWTIYKKFVSHSWSRGNPKLPYPDMRLSSATERVTRNSHLPKHSSGQQSGKWGCFWRRGFPASPPTFQDKRSPQHSPTLMHHQETAQLGQQIHQMISSSSTPQTVLQEMAQLLGYAFSVDCCWVTITAIDQLDTPTTGCWYAQAGATLPHKQLLGLQALMMPTATDISVINDINAQESSLSHKWQQLLPDGAILQIPAFYQGKLNGVVTLIRCQPYHWSDSDIRRARAIESSVATALTHLAQSLLITSLQQQVQRSELSKTLLKSLSMLSRSSLELNQILQMAIAGTAKTLEVSRGFILLLRYVDPLFKTRTREKIPKAKVSVVCEWSQKDDSSDSSTSDRASTSPNQSFWISECLLSQFAFTQFPQPVVITDQHDLSPIASSTDVAPLFNLSDIPSLLMIPLENQGTVLGFLVLQNSQVRHWHSEEISLLEMVSAQISTTIIQNQTLRQVQSLVDERTSQVQSSLEVQGKLYEKTRQQIDQLRQLNSLKDEFLSTMSHELRTPLTSMSLAIKMLRQPGINPERQAKYLDILEQQCTQEINLINDLLKLQQVESNQVPLKVETIDIKPLLQDLADCFTEKWADKGLGIKLDLPKTSLLFQTDTESFERILQELLTNAGKYSEPDTTVVLKVVHQVSQQVNQIVLTLTNTGSPISPEDLDHIFDKFRRGQGVTQQAIQGTGLGLALVKCLVQQLNGNISATSSAINDSSAYSTCFALTLPQLPSPTKL